MKLVNVKSKTFIDFGKENNHKDHKCKVGDHVRISKYENIFAKGCTPNQSEEVFVIKKFVPLTYVISDLNGEEILGTFYKKELQKANQTKFKIEKIIMRKFV